MRQRSIEWTDKVWNLSWSSTIQQTLENLEAPLHWKQALRVFVNSMSDLFHEDNPDEFIDRVFATMAIATQHTFQILTKRPERMRTYVECLCSESDRWERLGDAAAHLIGPLAYQRAGERRWPLPNVHMGVSIEDQPTADKRVETLLQTPAAVRWVLAEPLLGRVNLDKWLALTKNYHFRADVEGMLRNRSFGGLQHDDGRPMTRREAENALFAIHAKGIRYIPAAPNCQGFSQDEGCPGHPNPRLDWVVVGGESGQGSRPCDITWIRSIVRQCRETNQPIFVNQLGTKPMGLNEDCDRCNLQLSSGMHGLDCSQRWVRNKKNRRDMADWPADLRVREWPR